MKTAPFIALVVLSLISDTSSAQIVLGGESAVDFFRSAPTQSGRALNSGRPTFAYSGYLFTDAYLNEHVAALANLKMADNGYPVIDYFAVKLTDLTSLRLNLEVGKFDLPFGNLGERRYPRTNPLFSLPLIYEYKTTLPEYPPTQSDLIAGRGRGSGMPLLDGGMYDLGAMVFGSIGIFDYAAAVSNGTVSATSYYGENQNSDIGKVFRLAMTPFTGFTVGGAYAWGAFLEETASPPRSVDVNSYHQRTAEIDVEFSRGYAELNGEGVYSSWPVPFADGDQSLKALGFCVEGKYTLIPRLYVALRASGLNFSDAMLQGTTQPWDYDVTEWEGGMGWFFARDVLAKIVRRETRIHGGSYPKDNLTVFQVVIAY